MNKVFPYLNLDFKNLIVSKYHFKIYKGFLENGLISRRRQRKDMMSLGHLLILESKETLKENGGMWKGHKNQLGALTGQTGASK